MVFEVCIFQKLMLTFKNGNLRSVPSYAICKYTTAKLWPVPRKVISSGVRSGFGRAEALDSLHLKRLGISTADITIRDNDRPAKL